MQFHSWMEMCFGQTHIPHYSLCFCFLHGWLGIENIHCYSKKVELESHKLFIRWAESTRVTSLLACAQQVTWSVICRPAHSSINAVPVAAGVAQVPPPVLVSCIPAPAEASWYSSSACSQLFLELAVHLSRFSAHLGPGGLTIESMKIDSRLSGFLTFYMVPIRPITCWYVRVLCINHQAGSRNPVWVLKKYSCLVFLFSGGFQFAVHQQNIMKSRSCTNPL